MPWILVLIHTSVYKAYANNYGIIDNKWHLVTGDKEQIYDLGRNFYYVEENLGRNKTIDEFLHTDNFLLIDKNRHIRGSYSGVNNAAVQQLITDIKTLKMELLFICFCKFDLST
jgi:protein SCO1/2